MSRGDLLRREEAVQLPGQAFRSQVQLGERGANQAERVLPHRIEGMSTDPSDTSNPFNRDNAEALKSLRQINRELLVATMSDIAESVEQKCDEARDPGASSDYELDRPLVRRVIAVSAASPSSSPVTTSGESSLKFSMGKSTRRVQRATSRTKIAIPFWE
jgi:hypothetical protein